MATVMATKPFSFSLRLSFSLSAAQLLSGFHRVDVECQRVLLLGVRGIGFCASAECARCRCGNQAVRKGVLGGGASAFAASARRAAASRSAFR